MPNRLTTLEHAVRPIGVGVSFAAIRHGGLARVEPLTPTAAAWLRANTADEATWDEGALIMKLRYFPDSASAANEARLTFEIDQRIH